MAEQKAAAPPSSPFRTCRVSGSHPQAADLRQNPIKQTKKKHIDGCEFDVVVVSYFDILEGKINATD